MSPWFWLLFLALFVGLKRIAEHALSLPNWTRVPARDGERSRTTSSPTGELDRAA